MVDLLSSYYLWVKALHVMAVISWMAGLFYLPRLFVYHVEGLQKAGVERGSEMDLLFRHQERLLLNAIMTPAMYATWIFGLMLVFTPGIVGWTEIWPWAKAAAVIGMTAFHYWLAVQRLALVEGRNRLTGRQYRMANELPTVFMIVIVLAVIVRF
jgi:putative membrane protein